MQIKPYRGSFWFRPLFRTGRRLSNYKSTFWENWALNAFWGKDSSGNSRPYSCPAVDYEVLFLFELSSSLVKLGEGDEDGVFDHSTFLKLWLIPDIEMFDFLEFFILIELNYVGFPRRSFPVWHGKVVIPANVEISNPEKPLSYFLPHAGWGHNNELLFRRKDTSQPRWHGSFGEEPIDLTALNDGLRIVPSFYDGHLAHKTLEVFNWKGTVGFFKESLKRTYALLVELSIIEEIFGGFWELSNNCFHKLCPVSELESIIVCLLLFNITEVACSDGLPARRPWSVSRIDPDISV